MPNERLLRRHALRLWNGNRSLARRWLASVQFLRTPQGGGWILDGAPSWRVRGKV
jgi:hypothetical protein